MFSASEYVSTQRIYIKPPLMEQSHKVRERYLWDILHSFLSQCGKKSWIEGIKNHFMREL